MKYFFLIPLLLLTPSFVPPSYANASPASDVEKDCSELCLKLDVESGAMTNLDPQSPNFNANDIKINLSVIWKLNDPKSMQAKAQIMKQKLEDDKSLMLALANALAQKNMELARGLSILLAPRLKYSNPEKLITDIKAGSITVF